MKIESYDQLKEQQMLSRLRINQLEENIKINFQEIKKDFNPVNIVGRSIHQIINSEKIPIAAAAAGITINTLVRKLLLRKSNFITKSLVALMAGKFTSNIVSKNSDQILMWILSLIDKFKNHRKNKDEFFDESTADIELESA